LCKELGAVFHELARQKECRVIEGHLLISILPKSAVAQVIGFLKGKSANHVARTFGGRTKKFTGQHFWAHGYYVSTTGKDDEAVRRYIQEY
jgi:putative transposase